MDVSEAAPAAADGRREPAAEAADSRAEPGQRDAAGSTRTLETGH